jgi:hypothetical protein
MLHELEDTHIPYAVISIQIPFRSIFYRQEMARRTGGNFARSGLSDADTRGMESWALEPPQLWRREDLIMNAPADDRVQNKQ